MVRCRVCIKAFGKKDLAVAAFLAAYEYYQFVSCGKFANLVNAVCYLAANGVVAFESALTVIALIYLLHDVPESVQGFCGLRVKVYVAVEVDIADVLFVLQNNSFAVGLSH